MSKVIFLDFDGVIRIPINGGSGHHDECEFNQELMVKVAKLCKYVDAQIVVSSDWRNMENKEEISSLLEPHLDVLLHEDWGTPITGYRWNEILKWLSQHPEVSNYAILDDHDKHFEGAPPALLKRLVLTNAKVGISSHDIQQAAYILGNNTD